MESLWPGLLCGAWILILCMTTARSVTIDNGIAMGPEIECNAHALTLAASTRNPFNGRIYVKGESANPECVVNYTQQASNQIEISVPLMACNVKRLRIPGGAFEYTTTVVISFHHIFETKVDRAYRVHCVFAQLNNTFTAPSIEVSMIPTTETLTQTAGSVQCQYDVRRGSVNGERLQFAVIGETAYHVWKCDTAGMRILIRDCYVDDGGGNKVATVDARGCAVDRYVIQTPTYVGPDYTTAYTEAHVFKYADRPTVFFQCQIQLCDASDTACQETSPPTCNGALAATVGPNFSNFTGSAFGNQTVPPTTAAHRLGPSNATSPPPINQTGFPANLTAPSSNFTNQSLPILQGTTTSSFNLTNQTTRIYNLTTSFPVSNATNQTFSVGANTTTASYLNATITPVTSHNTTSPHENGTLSNVTLPFPTPGPMNIFDFGNHTNSSLPEGGRNNITRRIRETAYARTEPLDSYIWDVVSNEFTVMDLNQELKHGGDYADYPESQKIVDDASDLKLKDSDDVANFKSDKPKIDSRCVPGYEIALVVTVIITLMITTIAAVAVYWNLKNMRKTMFFHP